MILCGIKQLPDGSEVTLQQRAALGVKAIAVATGKHTVAELAAHVPDHVFEDLGDWRAAYEAIRA